MFIRKIKTRRLSIRIADDVLARLEAQLQQGSAYHRLGLHTKTAIVESLIMTYVPKAKRRETLDTLMDAITQHEEQRHAHTP
jgi:hypothetical protein